ncbi:MAG: hypothetical protein CSA26_01230 [Desulfobacterales bacterium]|nr:MAG: hypothetical protein CSA26_01230 [Desulfobacterales bacterium]
MTDNRDDFCQRKPDIEYPCIWEYKVIGTDQNNVREAIMTACSPAIPEIRLSNVSSKGTYYSLNARLEVDNEEMRLGIFDRIQKNPAVKMVI